MADAPIKLDQLAISNASYGLFRGWVKGFSAARFLVPLQVAGIMP
jgi:hypothetical protein